jgi:AraC-like DNA-binding protein
MDYCTFRPALPLSAFVDLFWLRTGYAQPHPKERLLPDGTTELVINLAEDSFRVYEREQTDRYTLFPGYMVSGVHSKFTVIDTAQQAVVIGVHFRPGGAFPFFGFPAHELRDSRVPLDALWGTTAALLREQLLEAPTSQAKFQILEQVLLTQLTQPLARHPAVNFALGQLPVSQNVAHIAEQVGLSTRRFGQLFNEQVGLTPKLFWRIRRFQQVVYCLKDGVAVDWSRLALDCGYFDQSHFIHDFQAFSGLNPTVYLNSQTPHLNHLPVIE